ncbi:MAG: hypothetical protein KY468_06520 [Armatimonadetes bacterium]|nr:hypothetical protein [Armatimonadota bacterium]
MRTPVLTIEYPVGNRTVRRRLSGKWPCPLCKAELEPAGNRSAGISRQLECPECKGTFRIVEIEMPEPFKPSRTFRGRSSATRPKPGKK